MDDQTLKTIRDVFAQQPIEKAWLFGSYSRGEESPTSDIDLLVVFDRSEKPVTLLTYATIWRTLQERLGRNVDLVEEGTLRPAVVKTANNDKVLIYERKN